MATLNINIPDDQVTRVVTALCTLQGVAVSPANAKQVLIAHIKADRVRLRERREHPHRDRRTACVA
jgi:hypothetical protein